ncbi:MAG TPA: PilZ domain-containing protein [Solirubrobacteraceae bacterium]|nr:PilZ domain-containing protein [Solirubrobacteraceae bacterium]
MKFGRSGGRGKQQKAADAGSIELPRRAESVTLVPFTGARIPARVVESSPQSLLIAIAVHVQPLTTRQLHALVVEFQGESGRVHLTGDAVVPDPSEPEVLRVDEPRALDVVQDREFVRVRSARPALVFGGPELVQINSYTVDISGGGFLLAGADVLQVGDRLHFQLDLPDGELAVTGTGRVVRIDQQGNRGVVFDEIKELDRRRLIRYIFDCQRAELRMGLQVGRHAD